MLEVADVAASDSKTTIAAPSVRSVAAVFFALGFTVFTLVTVFALADSRFVTMPLPPGLHAIRIAPRGYEIAPPHTLYSRFARSDATARSLHRATPRRISCVAPRRPALARALARADHHQRHIHDELLHEFASSRFIGPQEEFFF